MENKKSELEMAALKTEADQNGQTIEGYHGTVLDWAPVVGLVNTGIKMARNKLNITYSPKWGENVLWQGVTTGYALAATIAHFT